MGLTFFGLTPKLAKEYRAKFLTEIHEVCFYGQGGYSWTEVYAMPLWLRRFTYNKVKEYYDKQAEQYKKSQQKSNTKNLVGENGKVNTPKFLNKTSYK